MTRDESPLGLLSPYASGACISRSAAIYSAITSGHVLRTRSMQ